MSYFRIMSISFDISRYPDLGPHSSVGMLYQMSYFRIMSISFDISRYPDLGPHSSVGMLYQMSYFRLFYPPQLSCRQIQLCFAMYKN